MSLWLAGLIAGDLELLLALQKAFDWFVSVLVMVFFAGYLNIHSDLIGLESSPIPVTEQAEEFWELLTWVVFAFLAADVYLKFRAAGSARIFLRKHWLDLIMLAMLPLFAGFKIAKVAVKLVKSAKLSKSGFKAFNAAKKMAKD